MIKHYFTHSLVQFAIVLSLLRTDISNYFNRDYINYPEVQEIVFGQLSAFTVTQYHNAINSMNQHSRDLRKSIIDDDPLSFLRRRDFSNFQLESHIDAFLANHVTNGIVSHYDNNDNNSPLIEESFTNEIHTEQVHQENDTSVGLTSEDMDLIDVLWRQDMDLGVSREYFDVALRNELERDREIELQKLRIQAYEYELQQYKLQELQSQQAQQWLSHNYIQDGETGEYIPQPASKQHVDQAVYSNNDDLQFTFEEAFEILDRVASSTRPQYPNSTTNAKEKFSTYPESVPEANASLMLPYPSSDDVILFNTSLGSSHDSHSAPFDELQHYNSALNVSSNEHYSNSDFDTLSQAIQPQGLYNQHSYYQTLMSHQLTPRDMNGYSLPAEVNNQSDIMTSDSPPANLNTVEAFPYNSSLPLIDFDDSLFDCSEFDDLATGCPDDPGYNVENQQQQVPCVSDETVCNNQTIDSWCDLLKEMQTANENTEIPDSTGIAQVLPKFNEIDPCDEDLQMYLLNNGSMSDMSEDDTIRYLNFFDDISSDNGTVESFPVTTSFSDSAYDGSSDVSSVSGRSRSSQSSDLCEMLDAQILGATGGCEVTQVKPSSPDSKSETCVWDDRLIASNMSVFSNSSSNSGHLSNQSVSDGLSSNQSVSHNHSYPLKQLHDNGNNRKINSKRRKDDLSRDEERADDLQLPYSAQQIISCSIEEFGEMLKNRKLTKAQSQLIRDIRRRGKNKVAAQNCRKRKLVEITDLGSELSELEAQKLRLKRERKLLDEGTFKVKKDWNHLYSTIMSSLRNSNGEPYDWTRYSLQVGSDGEMVVVPMNQSTKEPLLPQRNKRDKR